MTESINSPVLLNSSNSNNVIIDIFPITRPKQSFLQRMWCPIPSIVRSTTLRSGEHKPSLLRRIVNVAASILNFGLGLMLYWTNNSLFAISLFIGIIKPDDVAYSIEKINAVWKTQPFNTLLIGGFGSILGGVGAVLSLPITVAAGSILYAANLGAHLSKKAQKILADRTSENLILQSH